MNVSEFGKFGAAFGLIRSPCERVALEFKEWQHGFLEQWGFELRSAPISGSINDVIKALLPRTAPIVTKYLFWPLTPEWTLYFDNGVNGTDPGAIGVLASRFNTDAIRVGIAEEVVEPSTGRIKQYGATIFEYHSGEVERRHVFSANDGGKWKFGQAGEPFPFECLDAYKARSIQERFTKSMLLQYLKELGLDLDGSISCPSAYSQGYLLTKHGRMPPSFKEVVEE